MLHSFHWSCVLLDPNSLAFIPHLTESPGGQSTGWGSRAQWSSVEPGWSPWGQKGAHLGGGAGWCISNSSLTPPACVPDGSSQAPVRFGGNAFVSCSSATVTVLEMSRGPGPQGHCWGNCRWNGALSSGRYTWKALSSWQVLAWRPESEAIAETRELGHCDMQRIQDSDTGQDGAPERF